MRDTLAVLIDAENISADHGSALFEAVDKLGVTVARRAFADFSRARVSGWQDLSRRHAIELQQVTSTGRGRNAADMALAIGAMHLLQSIHPDAFCIVSSDSDFTPLSIHLRANGKAVHGFGLSNASPSFRESCSTFFCLDQPVKGSGSDKSSALAAKVMPPGKPGALALLADIRQAAKTMTPDAQNWYRLSDLGTLLQRNGRSPTVADHGSSKLSAVVTSIPLLELRRVGQQSLFRFRTG